MSGQRKLFQLKTKAIIVAVMMTGRDSGTTIRHRVPISLQPSILDAIDDLLRYVQEELPDQEDRVWGAENVGRKIAQYVPIRCSFATIVYRGIIVTIFGIIRVTR